MQTLHVPEQETVAYPKGTEVYDTPDLPEAEYSSFHWYLINRHAEWCARWLRAFGLY